MNCYNHPSEVAVAQCTNCGKGLCAECAKSYESIICAACHETHKTETITKSIIYLAVYAVLFIIGYNLDFMAFGGRLSQPVFSGYILMSLVSGWQVFGNDSSTRTYYGMGILFAFVMKLMIYTFIGMISAPYNLIKTTVVLILAIRN